MRSCDRYGPADRLRLPSLEAALKTHSVPALRAFLEGERQFVGGWWDSAAMSHGRAREADPAFWLAYAREQYAIFWSVRQPAESLMKVLERHRFELPEPDRLLVEANMLRSRDSVAVALDRSRQITERYPSSWFGWLDYADELMHNGPLLGHSRAEARAGFQRALELNPNLIPVHEHLMLVAIQDRDTAAAAEGLRELVRLNAGPGLTADGYGNRMLQFRFLDAIVRGDTGLVRALTDSMARDPAPQAVGDGSFYDPFRYGFPAEQIRVSQRALQVGGAPDANGGTWQAARALVGVTGRVGFGTRCHGPVREERHQSGRGAPRLWTGGRWRVARRGETSVKRTRGARRR